MAKARMMMVTTSLTIPQMNIRNRIYIVRGPAIRQRGMKDRPTGFMMASLARFPIPSPQFPFLACPSYASSAVSAR
jgi:hypothetical protein